MKILGIAGSPRKGGNTDILLAEFLRGAADAGAEVEIINVRKEHFDPCISCGRCMKTGTCAVQDSFQPVLAKILEADHIVVASPIYFMALSGWVKALIDRCQCLWARKYTLNDPVPTVRDGMTRKGVFISTCGSKVKKAFDGAIFCLKFFYDVVGVVPYKNLVYWDIDDKGAINSHPTALQEVYQAGREIVVGEAGGK